MSKENKSRLYKHKGNLKWQGIKVEKYKQSGKDWSDILRQTLIGDKGETCKFHLRYFEIAPGGCSSFEKHKHEHVVICVRGKGRVTVGTKSHQMNFMDTIYIAPDTPHQLKNPFKKPFGFFCIVNAKRDKPKLLTS
ncbi:MAG: cupin domain-containing protein [Nitrospirae bacterium]|nr:MAG: cupin domain-containing protein [Nitrospirota bacterium]